MARRGFSWVFCSASLIFISFIFFISNPFLPTDQAPLSIANEVIAYYKAPKSNIWSDLSDDEFEDVLEYLYKVPNDLNLTRVGKATAWDNHIAIIEALVPNKTDAVTYLDTDSSTPPRWARVTINVGTTEQAGIVEYMVGPLPASSGTQILPLTFPYNSGRNFIKNPLPNYESILEWFASLGHEVSDIVDDLLGDVIEPGRNSNAPPLMALARPAAFENGTVSSWATVHSPGRNFDAWSLLPQGLYCHFTISGRDSSLWKINEWFYNGVLYSSTEEFRKAWKNGDIIKQKPNSDGRWTASHPDEQGIPGREKNTPVMVQPQGPRYKIDAKEKHISWMGYSFYLSVTQATGLSLWDVKFKDERILYELGLQEAMAHYAGNDPMSIGMVWLDTLFGMGFNMYELVPGYDCPAYATYLPVSFHQGEGTVTRNNSICIFEYTADYAMQRHTTPSHVTVSRNNYLVVRTVATVGNYDYTIDYTFYLDGTMEVKVRASGYIFGAYHQLEAMRNDLSTNRETPSYEYGYQVHDLVATSMHDHGLNFKADLDIAGTSNTLYRVDVAPYHHQYPWDGVRRSTMHLVHSVIEKEIGLDWPRNSGALYVVLNNESTNVWGEKRGYRITPGSGMGNPPHLTMENSTALGRAAEWAYHDLWVVKQHDWERRSASEYNAMEPEDPLVDFGKMIDGEGVVQEDLVIFFNLGTHHIPHSGDIPNTLMTTASSSVMLIPHNFHDRDPSRAAVQGVRLNMKGEEDGGGSDVKYYGATYKHGFKVDLDDFQPDLTVYQAPENGMMDLSWNSTLAAL